MNNEIDLKYGENTYQAARIEKSENTIAYETSAELSFNEIISLTKGLNLISEFYDVKAACTVKNSGICAVALGQSVSDAVIKIMDSDPGDCITSIVVVSSEVDSETAKFVKGSNIKAAP
jgi:phosphoribosylaminoimidazolecarboxamide formyltransferase/IMP cyclohydrolase